MSETFLFCVIAGLFLPLVMFQMVKFVPLKSAVEYYLHS